jgi:hypothetical protein
MTPTVHSRTQSEQTARQSSVFVRQTSPRWVADFFLSPSHRPSRGRSCAPWPGALSSLYVGRGFPSPWTVEDHDACFIVSDANGQALAYVYFEEDSGRLSAAKSLSKEEALRDRSELY